MVAILDFQHTQTSDSILVSLSVLPDLENIDAAVGISLLSSKQAEIHVTGFLQSHHLGFLTSACLLPAHKHQYSIRRLSVLDVWFAVAIMLLYS